MWIKGYILTIALVVLLSALAEALMPDSNMKKHISLVTGLIMLLAIAKPVISLPRFSLDDILFTLEDKVAVSGADISKSIVSAQLQAADTGFEEALSKAISNSIFDSLGIKCNVKAVAKEGSVSQIKLDCRESEEIREHIKQNYGLECVFERDGG